MTTNEREALLLCPFCGGEADYDQMPDDGSHDANKWNIGCVDMHCYGYEFRYRFERKADALKAWNTRAALDQRQEVTDEMLERACREFFVQQELKWGVGLVDVHQAHWKRIMRATLNAALQSIAPPVRVPEKMCVHSSGGTTYCHDYKVGDQIIAAHEEYARGWNACREAILSTSPRPQQAVPEWTWNWLMDYCRENGASPANHNKLFKLVSDMRAMLSSSSSSAPTYNGKKEG